LNEAIVAAIGRATGYRSTRHTIWIFRCDELTGSRVTDRRDGRVV